MGKAKSRKSIGDEIVNWFDEKTEKIPLIKRLKDQKEYSDKQISKATEPPKKKPYKPNTGQTKNKQMAKDLKRSRKLSKSDVEKIRSRLRKGEKVKTSEY